MSSASGTGNVISELLQNMVNEGLTTPRELAFVAETPLATVYDWLAQSNHREPSGTAIILWNKHHPNIEVRMRLTDLVTGGQAAWICRNDDLDFDGDGKITGADAWEVLIKDNDNHAQLLRELHEAWKDKRIDRDELVELRRLLGIIRKNSHVCEQVLLEAYRQQGVRRKARAPRLVSGDGGAA